MFSLEFNLKMVSTPIFNNDFQISLSSLFGYPEAYTVFWTGSRVIYRMSQRLLKPKIFNMGL
jgi:hypothetical protein